MFQKVDVAVRCASISNNSTQIFEFECECEGIRVTGFEESFCESNVQWVLWEITLNKAQIDTMHSFIIFKS